MPAVHLCAYSPGSLGFGVWGAAAALRRSSVQRAQGVVPRHATCNAPLGGYLSSSRVRRGPRAGGIRASSESAPTGRARAEELKRELLELVGEGGEGSQRMARLESRRRLEEVVEELLQIGPSDPAPVSSPLLLGRWQLLATYKPGTADVNFFSPDSWRRYLFDKGPSPVQSLVVGKSDVSNIYQILEDPSSPGTKWQNVVEFGENKLVIEAELEGVRDAASFFYRFSGGFFLLDGGERKLPYPVPFGVLEAVRPGQTRGYFDCGYLDEDLRVSTGDKGSVFVLRRPPDDSGAATQGLIG